MTRAEQVEAGWVMRRLVQEVGPAGSWRPGTVTR